MYSCGYYGCWIATFYMYAECSPVPFTSQLFLTVFLCGCFPLASSPGPSQKLGKGPGHTYKISCMYCVSSLGLEWTNHVRPLHS